MKTITETQPPPPPVTETRYVCEEPGCEYSTTFPERAEAHPGFHRATRRVVDGALYLHFQSAADVRAYIAAWDFPSSVGARKGFTATEKHPYSNHMRFPGWFTAREDSGGDTRLVSLNALREEIAEDIEEAKARLVALDVVRAGFTFVCRTCGRQYPEPTDLTHCQDGHGRLTRATPGEVAP